MARTPKSLINTEELGRAIRRRRAELDLSLRDVADQTNVSASTLSRIENGTGNRTLTTSPDLLRGWTCRSKEFSAAAAKTTMTPRPWSIIPMNRPRKLWKHISAPTAIFLRKLPMRCLNCFAWLTHNLVEQKQRQPENVAKFRTSLAGYNSTHDRL